MNMFKNLDELINFFLDWYEEEHECCPYCLTKREIIKNHGTLFIQNIKDYKSDLKYNCIKCNNTFNLHDFISERHIIKINSINYLFKIKELEFKIKELEFKFENKTIMQILKSKLNILVQNIKGIYDKN